MCACHSVHWCVHTSRVSRERAGRWAGGRCCYRARPGSHGRWIGHLMTRCPCLSCFSFVPIHTHTFAWLGLPFWGSKCASSCVCHHRGSGCPARRLSSPCCSRCLLGLCEFLCVCTCVCVCTPCCWILVSSPRAWHILSMSVSACCGRPCTPSWSVPGDVACIQSVWLCVLKAV